MSHINFLITHIMIFCAVIAVLTLRWLRKKSGESQWYLSYSISVQLLTIVGLFFVFMGVSLLIELTPGVAAKVLVIILSIPASVLVLLAAAEVYASETSYNESMIFRLTPWRQLIAIPFDDVIRIENSPMRYQFTIHSKDGQVIRVCKWADRAEDVLAYAEEGLEARNDPSLVVTHDKGS